MIDERGKTMKNIGIKMGLVFWTATIFLTSPLEGCGSARRADADG